jgi:hypothetical protein
MSRKFILRLIAAASLSAIALAPTFASAHGSGHSGGGSSPHMSSGMGRSVMGSRFIGPSVHRDFDGRHFHRFGFRYFPVASYDPCWVTETVPTPVGPRLRRVNVCGY